MEDPTDLWGENPFFILALPPTCDRMTVEREGKKLLGLLELKVASAASYATPLGPRPRTAEKVRWAMAELRAPEKRFVHEFWAQGPLPSADSAPMEPPDPLAPWPDIWVALGWRRSR